ncbi:MAG: 16S rRNA (cytidine(1402)-2'-O)-methyltransferase [Porticoccaceae bacterium]
MDKSGNLYVVATPIGNLGDMVPRALQVLQQADWVAAEDTRHSGRLLAHFAVTTPLIAYHDHSDERQLNRILDLLGAGQSVALISDAGTPLISDPGYRLVREARARGATIVPVPGPCAAITALCAAGLPSDRFTFEGFLPAKSPQRRATLDALAAETRTLIFYEAPHRILATLEDMAAVLGPAREALLARELTKTHETLIFAPLATLVERVRGDGNQQRGEIVLVVRGAEESASGADEAEQLRVLKLLMDELPLKQAAALAAKITGASKNALYQQALLLRG